jgi:acyl-CoA thioesterase II
MDLTVSALLDSLALERVADDQYRADNVRMGHQVVFGGQLLAQSIVAGLLGHEGKTVKTLHTVFVRGAAPDAALDITVDRMQAGRTFGSSTVTISQAGRLCTRSLVLLSADEPDLIRHADDHEIVEVPGQNGAAAGHGGDWEVRVVDGVDVSDPDLVGPPDLDVWSRFVGAPSDPVTDQALIAFATDGFLIGTAMRPHKGVGQAQAHVTLSTGVITHTITFHEPCPAAEWLLLSHHSSYAGRGRVYGRADMFRESGQLVASFVQDAMVRPMNPERKGAL